MLARLFHALVDRPPKIGPPQKLPTLIIYLTAYISFKQGPFVALAPHQPLSHARSSLLRSLARAMFSHSLF